MKLAEYYPLDSLFEARILYFSFLCSELSEGDCERMYKNMKKDADNVLITLQKQLKNA